jgi:hypothetical protein
MFTARNAVLLALLQVGVIVGGTLATGITRKLWGDMELPFATFFLSNYGVALFTLPLGWITFAMVARLNAKLSDEARDLVFSLGFLILFGLILFEGYAVLNPLGQLCTLEFATIE